MTKLLMIREQLKKIYGVYGIYIKPIVNFAVVLISLIIINANIGAMELLKNPVVVIILSLVGAFLPVKLVTIYLSLIILAHMSAISVEAAGVVFLIMLVMYMLFFRFTPKDSPILILVPLLFFIKIPYVVPLTVGMVCTPLSIISVSFGVVMYYMLNYIGINMDGIMKTSAMDGFVQIFTSKGLYLTIVAFALVIVAVYFIKRLSIDYSWIVAVITGGVLCIIIMLIGVLAFEMKDVVSVTSVIAGGIISILLALGIRFFVHSVDYSRTEYTQFEDDDFYYYVKAVPKIKVSTPEVNIKRINARKVKKK